MLVRIIIWDLLKRTVYVPKRQQRLLTSRDCLHAVRFSNLVNNSIYKVMQTLSLMKYPLCSTSVFSMFVIFSVYVL